MENIKHLLNQIEEKVKDIGLKSNTEYMSFNQKEDHVLTNSEGITLKKVKYFNYLGSFIGSTAQDIDERIAKAWGAITSMTKIWESKLSERLKRNFFRATVESFLTYVATTWTLRKTLENRLNGSYTRMIRAALNKSWKEHLTKEELYKRIPMVTETIRKQRTSFAGHCRRADNELAITVLLWQPQQGQRSRGRPAKTYVDQLVEDTECTLEEIPNAMNDRDGWIKRVNECRASSTW